MLRCGRPLINLLLLIINLLNLSFMTSSQNASRPLFRPSDGIEDYYNEFEDAEPPSSSPTQFEDPENNQCLYDMCVEQQETCLNLSIKARCLCPGLSGHDIRPSAPRLLKLSEEDGKGVVVHWCAPTSMVSYYVIWVYAKDIHKTIQVEEKKRTALLGDVETGVRVCVQAVNSAGLSEHEIQACTTFEPQHSHSGLALKLGIIGGVVGLIVLLLLAILLWRHKTRHKSSARTETERRADEVL
ncbi:leucine-rich repeat neuronal protein 4-like [Xyrauchen texanus]|uniref:leucine-rich repeat neuronal protein 4-like n=1 Tax=Xyrauchen texanus TaxID=154827 RepID=UPI002242AC85|nr:leucine-rich repeat neuronal protein 4-like [Xyrauchen texanus]XP_051967706.1 leucine-rich repeat neuronal protein 4-like [Xyrauchen texanus]XP_051967714.1 leucine-rich repeat neuronal protein 4-like [Xyrauchen texanus]